MRPILDVARDKLGIPAEHVQPYGHYKAKIALDYIESLSTRPDGKLILVTAITPTPAGEGKTTTTVGLTDAPQPHRQEGAVLPARAESRPMFRRQGRRGRRRLRPGRADGGHQPPFHRRLSRHRRRQQPARRADRQSRLLGQRARARHAPHQLAPRRRHERPRAALDRLLARRRLQRFFARGRLRHHRRVGSDGDLLPRVQLRRSADAARQYRRRTDAGKEEHPLQRSEGGGLDGRAAQGRHRAQSRADAGEQSGVHPRRSVRQYRAWLQFGDRDEIRA